MAPSATPQAPLGIRSSRCASDPMSPFVAVLFLLGVLHGCEAFAVTAKPIAIRPATKIMRPQQLVVMEAEEPAEPAKEPAAEEADKDPSPPAYMPTEDEIMTVMRSYDWTTSTARSFEEKKAVAIQVLMDENDPVAIAKAAAAKAEKEAAAKAKKEAAAAAKKQKQEEAAAAAAKRKEEAAAKKEAAAAAAKLRKEEAAAKKAAKGTVVGTKKKAGFTNPFAKKQ